MSDSDIEVRDKVIYEGGLFKVTEIVAGAASLVEFPYYSNSATVIVPLDDIEPASKVDECRFIVKYRKRDLDRKQKYYDTACDELMKAESEATGE